MRKAKLSPPIYHHNKPLYIGKVRIVVAIAYVNAGIAATPHTTLATFANLSLLSPLNINGTNNPISAPMQFISTSVLSASPSPVKACSSSNATLNKKASTPDAPFACPKKRHVYPKRYKASYIGKRLFGITVASDFAEKRLERNKTDFKSDRKRQSLQFKAALYVVRRIELQHDDPHKQQHIDDKSRREYRIIQSV